MHKIKSTFFLLIMLGGTALASGPDFNDTDNKPPSANNPVFAGNVGIGTTNPDAPLNISANTTDLVILKVGPAVSHALIVRDGAGSEMASILGNGNIVATAGSFIGNGFLDPGTNKQGIQVDTVNLYFVTNNIIRGTILNNGNVGIGTTAPVAGFDLVGAGTTAAASSLIIRDSNKIAKVTILNDGNVGVGTAVPLAAIDVVGIGLTNATSSMIIRDSNKAVKIAVLNDGSVGIGTSVPLATMDLVGAGATSATSSLVIRDSTKAPKVTILDSGSVGIGSSSPSAKLNVVGALVLAPVALADAATVNTNAALGNYFTLISTQSFTLANPTNPVHGQKLVWRIKQDATGGRVLTLGAKFRFGTDIPSAVLSTGANKIDYLGAVYDATDDKWDVIAFVKGY